MPNIGKRWMVRCAAAGAVAIAFAGTAGAQQASQPPTPSASSSSSDVPYRAVVNTYCVSCHNARTKAGGLELDAINTQPVGDHADAWEKVVRKLHARQMPPIGARRPDEAAYVASLASLEASLDRVATAAPNPGRTDTFRRLNRTEYRNAIRDLLALDIDVTALLPSDSASFGFDNITVGNLSPTLLEGYVTAAEKISRLAVGRPSLSMGGSTVRIPPDITQENHLDGLPIGTRGGALISHEFPLNGEYEITIRLARDRNEHIEGLLDAHEIELLLDEKQLRVFTIEPLKLEQSGPASEAPSHANLDEHLKVRVPVTAGPHKLAVAFPKKPFLLLETARRPYEAHFNYYRHPRLQPAVYEISIVGPYNAAGAGDTPSRRRVFVCQPGSNESACAKKILSTLMRRAYRRPVSDADLRKPFELYQSARAEEGFDAGIELGLSAILSSPEFLFRIERDPTSAAGAATVGKPSSYSISDLELASRLSFFLWSSIPDDELLDVAARGDLDKPAVLERQVKRMLADPKAENLVTNFASQWLHLRNLETMTPDMRLFPDFDDNLRQAFRRETEMLVSSVIAENRSVLDLVNANYTFLNERLAKHYGIPNIYGSRFRKVTFDDGPAPSSIDGIGPRRGGLLRQGSILFVTSYPTRTSPVIRGKWILENVMGVPPPPPPATVPALDDVKGVKKNAPVRERLAEHRKNPTCAACHRLTDPVGFALENYDAMGRWRTMDGGERIDASGTLFNGAELNGVASLEKAILDRPELFVSTLTEKLLTFATGRGVAHYDAPAVRKIVRDSSTGNYRFSSIVMGIVTSVPFRMRTTS